MANTAFTSVALGPVPGPYVTKQAMVEAALRDAIVEGRYAPGQRLVIDDLAKALAVSPIPVREALQRLQKEGLVTIRPHAGAVVTALQPEAIRELFALMEALELVAVRAAATRCDAAATALLRGHLARLRATAGDPLAWAAENSAFHRAIVAIAGLPLVAELTERVFAQWEQLRRRVFASVRGDRSAAEVEHRALVAALIAGDGAGAAAIVQAHNQAALARYLLIEQPSPARRRR